VDTALPREPTPLPGPPPSSRKALGERRKSGPDGPATTQLPEIDYTADSSTALDSGSSDEVLGRELSVCLDPTHKKPTMAPGGSRLMHQYGHAVKSF